MAYHYDQPPPVRVQHHRSPSFSYLAEQAIPDFGRSYGHFQSPMDMREALVREDEKERMRGGIIAEEIARLRMLEEELALRRVGRLPPHGSMGISGDGVPPDRRWGFNEPRAERQDLKPMISEIPHKKHSVKYENFEFNEQLSKELKISGVGATSERCKEKDKLLAKADANLSGVKRRAEMAAEAVISSNLPTTGAPKNNTDLVRNTQKSKELPMKKFKFWCNLCNVGAFAENVMKEHERGKKHTAMLREMNTNGIVTQMNDKEEAGKRC